MHTLETDAARFLGMLGDSCAAGADMTMRFLDDEWD
jgi:hypothetical protein